MQAQQQGHERRRSSGLHGQIKMPKAGTNEERIPDCLWHQAWLDCLEKGMARLPIEKAWLNRPTAWTWRQRDEGLQKRVAPLIDLRVAFPIKENHRIAAAIRAFVPYRSPALP